ncbi:DUF2007 domain-containing protein [bacterium]|nr:DUF2007 domain-containing protein [bacterium]MDB4653248.1 DUF2007 domain-containing protein [Akkermansiaceae bacterium]
MKEVYRHHEFIRVNHFRDLVEAAGIPTMLRNEHLVHGVVEIPIPEFYPNLCVMNEEDYEEAWTIINNVIEAEKAPPGDDVSCPECGENNPANFAECFACQTPIVTSNPC